MRQMIFLMAAMAMGFVLSCGDPTRETQPSDGENQQSTRNEAGSTRGAKPSSAEPAEVVFKGKAVTSAQSDGGHSPSGSVRLVLGSAEQVSGSLRIGDSSFELSGMAQEENLRLWATSPADEQGDIKRGYLLGKKSGQGFSGRFAISGNGGKPSISGTWEVAVK
ncbi:MAG: hypothetical protein QNJ97_22390 [Myxococcota bacterium]|nr:hypothetical protein [Myxococcota bacterium]